MITEVKALNESRYRTEPIVGGLPKEARPVLVIRWIPGRMAFAWDLMLSNPSHCTYFEQHDLVTHQTQNLALVTPEFVEAAKRSKLKFEVIEEVM